MMYSRTHKLFFVHIPKCAGNSVSRGLRTIAAFPISEMAADMKLLETDAKSRLEAFYFNHPALGNIHPAHIPLRFLRDYFSATWGALINSDSFAVTRDPRDRFLSAIMQRLREFRGIGPTKVDFAMIRSEAESTIAWLGRREQFCDVEYIHFSRQVDYVKLEGEQIVSKVFSIDHLSMLEKWLGESYGILPFSSDERNQSQQMKKWARTIGPVASNFARSVLTKRLRRVLYPLWLKSGAFIPAASQYKYMDLGAGLEKFIDSYYSEDVALHRQASSIPVDG